jgi:transposase
MRTPLTVTRAGAVKGLTAALRRERQLASQVRIRAVLAVARGRHVPAVAEAMSVAERAVRNWVHRYNREGLAGLRDRRTGRQCRLSRAQLEKVRGRIRAGPGPEDGICSLRASDIQRILQKEFQVRYARSSVYYLLHHQLGMSYLKPRPLHRKADPRTQAAFKKTSQNASKGSGRGIRTGGWKSGSRTRAGLGSRAP